MIQQKTNEIRLSFFARIFLILGGINYLYLAMVSKGGFLFLTLPKNILNIIYFIIGIAALYLMFNRDYYLPFLGETVVPSIIPLKKDTKNLIKTTIKNLPPNSTVIYWAAKTGESTILDPYKAYDDYSNSGVSLSNEKGEAEIEYECPVSYKVGKFGFMKKLLPKHIHYRYIDPKLQGFMSPVDTIFLNAECK
jgi:hypothetical protein